MKEPTPSNEQPITLNSIGFICSALQIAPQIIAVAARDLGVMPSTVNGIAHFSDAQVDRITAYISATASAVTPAQAVEPAAAPTIMEPSAEHRQEARRDPMDLLDDIEAEADPARRANLCIALAMSCGSRSDELATLYRDDLIGLLQRIATGDMSLIDDTRDWIIEHVVVSTESEAE
jgi:hypothetical protein